MPRKTIRADRVPGPWKKVATRMWDRDGQPEWSINDPGSVGRHSYERWAKDVVATLRELGYEVKRVASKGQP